MEPGNTIGSVTLFIATEVAAAYGAGVLALSGLLGLNPPATRMLATPLAVPAIYAVFLCAKLALAAGTDPAND